MPSLFIVPQPNKARMPLIEQQDKKLSGVADSVALAGADFKLANLSG